MPFIGEPKILHVIVLAILAVVGLELCAMHMGMNGTCMRTAVTTIGALAGVGGGWGLKAMVETKRDKIS